MVRGREFDAPRVHASRSNTPSSGQVPVKTLGHGEDGLGGLQTLRRHKPETVGVHADERKYHRLNQRRNTHLAGLEDDEPSRGLLLTTLYQLLQDDLLGPVHYERNQLTPFVDYLQTRNKGIQVNRPELTDCLKPVQRPGDAFQPTRERCKRFWRS